MIVPPRSSGVEYHLALGFSDDGVEFAEDGSDDEETAGNLLAPPSAAANLSNIPPLSDGLYSNLSLPQLRRTLTISKQPLTMVTQPFPCTE